MSELKNGTYEINVLGSKYTVTFSDDEEKYPLLSKSNGYCDCTINEIVVRNGWDDEEVGSIDYLIRKNARHEIIHAFLDESGLRNDSDKAIAWAVNEEMVDWFAIQSPKIYKIFEELDVL